MKTDSLNTSSQNKTTTKQKDTELKTIPLGSLKIVQGGMARTCFCAKQM